MKFTVVGATGFIGKELVNFLRSENHEVLEIKKEIPSSSVALGVVIYCAGYGDCMNGSENVIDANVGFLSKIIVSGSYEHLFYLSSTRVYLHNTDSKEESDVLLKNSDSRRLFNISKLAAEELCLRYTEKTTILRPSNIYGLAIKSPLYLPAIVRDALLKKEVNMFVSPNYSKDYLLVSSLVEAIYKLASKTKLEHRCYNVASGVNVSASELSELIRSETKCEIKWHDVDESKEDFFPETDINRLQEEIDFQPSMVIDDIPKMITMFRNYYKDKGLL